MARESASGRYALQLGQMSLADGQLDRAADAFRLAIRENPRQPEAYAGLGDVMFARHHLDRALDCYQLAGRFSRGDYVYLQKVADVQERLGRVQDAGRTYLAAGEILRQLGRHDEAVANWRRAVRLEPELAGAHLRLAAEYQRRGNVPAAVREFLAVARTLQSRGDDKAALQMCVAAKRLDPANSHIDIAIALILDGRSQELPFPAPPAAQERVAAPPNPTDDFQGGGGVNMEPAGATLRPGVPHNDLPEMLKQARHNAQDKLAAEIFRDEREGELLRDAGNLGLTKLERDALIGQAVDFQMRGRAGSAIACYERAIAGGLTLPEAYFTVGMLYLDLSKYAEARRAFLQASDDPLLQEPIATALALMR